MSDIPPGRYRIVERKGRIIVTDTWAAGNRPAPPHARAPIATGPGRPAGRLASARAALARLACLGARDDAERPILSTNHHFDEKGPRSIALGPAGAERLGTALLTMVGGTGALILLLFIWQSAAILAIFVIGLGFASVNTTARPAITRWLDRLDEKTAR